MISLKDDIGSRLKSERTRLGFSQTDFGAIGGVQKLAQINYEKGERFPGADYLQAIAKEGADVQFIITGDARNTVRGCTGKRSLPNQAGRGQSLSALPMQLRHEGKSPGDADTTSCVPAQLIDHYI